MMNNLDYLWKIEEYISREIQFSDSKAGTVIAVSTLSIGLLAVLPISTLSSKEATLTLLFGFPLFLSLTFALISIYPRQYYVSGSSNIFWKHISKYNKYAEYEDDFHHSDKESEVLKQVYSLAKIASYKYQWMSKATICQITGLISFWIFIGALFILK